MKWRFWTGKKTAHQRAVESAERTDNGKFAPMLPERTAAPQTEKKLETETRMFSTLADGFRSIDQLLQARDAAIDAKVAAALDGYQGGDEQIDGLSSWAPFLEALAPYVGPYIPQIMSKLGFQDPGNHEVTTSTDALPIPSPQAAVGGTAAAPGQGFNVQQLIKLAAHSNPQLIKPFVGTMNEKLAAANIDPDEFKAAVKNLAKVY